MSSRCKEIYDLAFDSNVRLTCGLNEGHSQEMHLDEIQQVEWRKPPTSGIGVTVLRVPPRLEAAVVS
jgi:hypothetical protein